jgi:hypothetical protein
VNSNLDGAERHRLRGLTRPVPEFVEIGLALATIRQRRLYRLEFATFEEYCRARWGFSRRRAYQLIASARVYVQLLNRS